MMNIGTAGTFLFTNSTKVMYHVIAVLPLGIGRKGRGPSAVKGLRFAFIQRAPGQLGKDFSIQWSFT